MPKENERIDDFCSFIRRVVGKTRLKFIGLSLFSYSEAKIYLHVKIIAEEKFLSSRAQD